MRVGRVADQGGLTVVVEFCARLLRHSETNTSTLPAAFARRIVHEIAASGASDDIGCGYAAVGPYARSNQGHPVRRPRHHIRATLDLNRAVGSATVEPVVIQRGNDGGLWKAVVEDRVGIR